MIRLTIFLALFVLAKAEDLLGVDYSFDIDFYTNFDNKKCDHKNMWQIVRYGVLDIESPFKSDRAIRALGESCASSFPIIFIAGMLQVHVYTQVISQFSMISIQVFDEDGICVTSYVYQRSSEGFRQGWQTISLKINKHFKGYIHLRGKSLKNETLLIDSFQYIPSDLIPFNSKKAKRSVDYEREDEDEIIFNYKTLKEYEDELESSGDMEPDEPPADQPVTEEPVNTFWNPFTITMVSFGGGVFVTMVIVGAYHYGKVRAMNNTPRTYNEVEPPRTITIPRADSRSNRMNRSRYYDF